MNHLQVNSPPLQMVNMAAYQAALFGCLNGPELEERGAKYRTYDAAMIHFDSNMPILFNFPDRKLNVEYAVQEFLWYVRGDKYDDSIEQHATAWKKLKQEDGSFFSNYGHYIFTKMTPDGISPFKFAFEQLVRNAGSRRAAIPLLETKHCFHENTDMVCTFSIQFFIRGSFLNMIVNMRSNDAIWGLTNDAFCFSMLHRLMYCVLANRYPQLQLGIYTHIANTLHVYERHYEMAQRIVETDLRGLQMIDIPLFATGDAIKMLHRDTNGLKWTNSLLSSGS